MRSWAGGAGIAAVFLCLAAGAGTAQPRLQSEQADVRLRIQGAVSLTGETPLALGDLPTGTYRLRAEGLGLARARGRLEHLSGDALAVRSWADFRSVLLPPGITHLGAGESWRGIVLLAAAGVSGIQAVRMDNAHADAVDAVEAAVTDYEQSLSEEAIARSTARLRLARSKEDDEKELRGLWASYFAATWIGTAVEALLLTPNPSMHVGSDGNYLLSVPSADGWGAAIRSLLVPGSGQRFLGRETKGNLFTASVLGLGAGTLIAHESFLSARRDQFAAQSAYDVARTDEELRSARRALNDAAGKTDDRNRTRWVLFGATLGAYVWNIVDAALDGSRSAEASSLQWSVIPKSDGMTAGLTWRLP